MTHVTREKEMELSSLEFPAVPPRLIFIVLYYYTHTTQHTELTPKLTLPGIGPGGSGTRTPRFHKGFVGLRAPTRFVSPRTEGHPVQPANPVDP